MEQKQLYAARLANAANSPTHIVWFDIFPYCYDGLSSSVSARENFKCPDYFIYYSIEFKYNVAVASKSCAFPGYIVINESVECYLKSLHDHYRWGLSIVDALMVSDIVVFCSNVYRAVYFV